MHGQRTTQQPQRPALVNRPGVTLCGGKVSLIPPLERPELAGFGAGYATLATLVQLNRAEAAEFAGLSPDTPAEDLAQAAHEIASPHATVVTCGRHGSCGYSGRGRPVFCKGRELNGRFQVGNGDRFHAFVHWAMRMTNGDLQQSLKWATDKTCYGL